MAQTSNSASSPYCSAPQMLMCYAKPILADMLRAAPDSPPPSYLAIIDSSNPAGKRLLNHLKVGAGEIESACAVAQRYVPLDLQALSGVSQLLLIKLNAARAMWSLAQYLKPMSARPDDVPMAKESAEMLQLLKDGERIFSFDETERAGLPSVVQAQPNKLLTANVVRRAIRLFPGAQLNDLIGGGS